MRSVSSAARSCRTGAFLVLALLAFPGLADGDGPGPEPAVAPTITATVPAANAVEVDGTAPIEVRFSEPMNATTLGVTISPSAGLNVSWAAPDVLRLVPEPPGLSDCTVYGVLVTVRDLDEDLPLEGGVVPNPWYFMTTCNLPYLLDTKPADGATNVPLDSQIVVTFSDTMDCLTLSVQFMPALPPPASMLTSCDASNTTLTVRLTGGTAFVSATRYAATVLGKDTAGNDLVPSLVPNPFSFTVNSPPSVSKPMLSASGCLDSGTSLTISWTMSDDREAASNLTVNVTFLNGSREDTIMGPVRGLPSNPIVPWTLSAVDVTTRVRVEVNDSASGVGWNESDAFRIDTGPPRVLGTNPQDGAQDVPFDGNIMIVFSEPMNRASVEAAYSSDPAMPGARFSWSPDNRTLEVPTGILRDRTTYRVTIGPTARDTCGPGRTMVASYSFSFTTAKAPAAPPARFYVTRRTDTTVSLAWDPVTIFTTGSPIPSGSSIVYQIYRGNATLLGTRVYETSATEVTETGLQPSTDYVYWIVAVVDGVRSQEIPLAVRTLDPFWATPEGRVSLLITLAAILTALIAGAQMRRTRKRAEADARLAVEVRDVVDRVRKVRAEPDPAVRTAQERDLQAYFQKLVEGEGGEDRPHPRLEGLYRALAQALVHSPEVDVSRGREVVDGRLGRLAPQVQKHGASYRLLSEAEASVQSELFVTLPPSARKALLLVYFYALEEYLSTRLRELVPAGATVLLGERGHINVRRKGWEAQWASLSLGTLLYLSDRNRHFFVRNEDVWEETVEPLLRQAVEARNRTAHPLRPPPSLDQVRELVYGAFSGLEGSLRRPKGPPAA